MHHSQSIVGPSCRELSYLYLFVSFYVVDKYIICIFSSSFIAQGEVDEETQEKIGAFSNFGIRPKTIEKLHGKEEKSLYAKFMI